MSAICVALKTTNGPRITKTKTNMQHSPYIRITAQDNQWRWLGTLPAVS